MNRVKQIVKPARAGESPGAVLALWNDIDPAFTDEYERWHTIEHVPERVWVPGFRTATRYVGDCANQPRYFTLYELDSLDCLDSVHYRTLVEEPTPWSRAMRPAFRNFFRMTCLVSAQRGAIHGAGLVVMRAVWAQTPDWELSLAELSDLADTLTDSGGNECVTRVQIGRQKAAGPQAIRNEDSAPDGVEYLFLVQTSRLEHIGRVERLLSEKSACFASVAMWQQFNRYRFASQVWHRDVGQPSRPMPRVHSTR